MTELERWIRDTLRPERMTTAQLAYEHMESQSGGCLPVLYQPLDHTKRPHWHDTALIGAFAHAMGEAETVLDIGPGDGWPSLRVADRFERVVGIDPSPKRVEVQRENARRLGITNVEFLVMDAEEMDFTDGTFDGVMAASAIEQCDHPERALAEVARVLRPGGRFAMIFEDYDGYFPDCDGDEELWIEAGEPSEIEEGRADLVLMYQVRTKDPPHEARYGFFLDSWHLNRAGAIAYSVASLGGGQSLRRRTNPRGEEPMDTRLLEVEFFEKLAPFTHRSGYYELDHMTTGTVDVLLERHGFRGVRHLDHRLLSVLDTFNALEQAGTLGAHRDSFVDECLALGAEAVEAAGDGPGDFVVAERSGSSRRV
jgi:SAM-dependent methyltransferase